MMTPEERAKADEALRIFVRHVCYRSGYLNTHTCFACREAWPCAAIRRARELTADLSEEVD